MKTDEELNARIEELCETHRGQLDDLYRAVGMMVVGKYFGWRVMRLVSTRSDWANAVKLFEDPKEWMRERGRFADRSLGLKIADEMGKFWEIIKGHVSVSAHDRRGTVDR
jgi:hypothetical protein